MKAFTIRAGSDTTAGFTLIELLVVLTLLGLFVSAVLGAVRFGTRAMDRTIAAAEDRQEIEAAHRFLRRLLSETGEPRDPGKRDEYPVLIGDAERLRLFAPMPRHLALSGRAQVELQVRRADRGAVIEVAWQPAFPRDGVDVPVIDTTLAAGITVAEFAYFGNPATAGTATWHRAWTTPARLPTLVRISVVGADGRPWPDLLVALPLAARAEILQ